MNNKTKKNSLLSAFKRLISEPSIKYQKSIVMTGASLLLLAAPSLHAEMNIARSHYSRYVSEAKASRFLTQATMGATISEINALGARIRAIGERPAFEEWIDQQFEMPRGESMSNQGKAMAQADGQSEGANNIGTYWGQVWWDQAVNAPDQLRQRSAFALSQIFVVSNNFWNGLYRNGRWRINAKYYDKLLDSVTGSHRDLLETITYDPFMGNYLTFAQNGKGDPAADIFPDENYAREVMQLFSCGVYSLNRNGTVILSGGVPVENYTEADVGEFAQVFTGLTQRRGYGAIPAFLATPLGNPTYMNRPMQMNEEYHDTSTKVLLDGLVLPAGQSGNQDISDTLDHLSNHSSTAPYMSRLLIQRFTSSNPSNQYVRRIATSWINNNGSFKSVIKAILLDTEARDAVSYSLGRWGWRWIVQAEVVDPLAGRLKEPLLKWTQLYNFAEAFANSPDGLLRMPTNADAPGQDILGASSVFNFYDSDYAPSNGPIGDYREASNIDVVSPEMSLLPVTVIPDFEQVYSMATALGSSTVPHYSANGRVTDLFLPGLEDLNVRVGSVGGFIRQIDLALCGAQMPYSLVKEVENKMNASGHTKEQKFAEVFALIFNSADFSVSH